MSRADVEAGVKAGLEAAAEILDKQMWWEGRDKIRAIDPAAIAATVPESEPWVGPPDLYEENRRLQKELAAPEIARAVLEMVARRLDDEDSTNASAIVRAFSKEITDAQR